MAAKEDAEKERDELRFERHKDRARQRNIERAAPERRSKLERDRDRDISEQIALGLPAKTTATGEGMFDARLFNQSKGMDSGFNDDETYGVYDQPWRKEGSLANTIYRWEYRLDITFELAPVYFIVCYFSLCSFVHLDTGTIQNRPKLFRYLNL